MTEKRIDSINYRHTFFGILNKDGDFWTPTAFESEQAAEQRLHDFWGWKKWNESDFKIVPVRIQLTTLPPEKE